MGVFCCPKYPSVVGAPRDTEEASRPSLVSRSLVHLTVLLRLYDPSHYNNLPYFSHEPTVHLTWNLISPRNKRPRCESNERPKRRPPRMPALLMPVLPRRKRKMSLLKVKASVPRISV